MVLPPRSCNTWASCVEHSVCVCASDRASLEITMPHRSIQTLGFEKVGEAQKYRKLFSFFHIESYDFGTCLRKSSMLHCHPHWSPCDASGTPIRNMISFPVKYRWMPSASHFPFGLMWHHVFLFFWGEGQRLNRIKHISDLSSW